MLLINYYYTFIIAYYHHRDLTYNCFLHSHSKKILLKNVFVQLRHYYFSSYKAASATLINTCTQFSKIQLTKLQSCLSKSSGLVLSICCAFTIKLYQDCKIQHCQIWSLGSPLEKTAFCFQRETRREMSVADSLKPFL